MTRIRFALLFSFSVFLFGCERTDRVVLENLLRDGGEYWESLTVDGKPAGFQRTAVSNEEIDGRPMIRFELQSRMTILRYGNRFDIAMKLDSLSDADGSFRSCDVQLTGGGEAIETACRIENGRLIVSGSKSRADIPWKEKLPGPEAVVRTLLQKPMLPREKRTVTYFEPSMLQTVETTLVAENVEPCETDGGRRKLLRIAMRSEGRMRHGIEDGAKTPPMLLAGTLWCDGGGNIVRNEMAMGGDQAIVAVRTSKTNALAAASKDPEVELGGLGVVPLDRPIVRPHEADRVSFIVQMKNGSPLDRFPDTPFQEVVSMGDTLAKITVWSAVGDDPTSYGNKAFKAKPGGPGMEDLASSRLIDLDDPKLAELAAKVDSASLTRWQTAVALEKLVHDTLRPTTFSIGLGTSSEVLKTGQGDCTEYAVLLAALCRAKKIPARVALGLVYTPFVTKDESDTENESRSAAGGGMAFHLWNEVSIDGVWRPLDATLGLGGADAARIKIADDALAGDSLAALVASISSVLGQVGINVAGR